MFVRSWTIGADLSLELVQPGHSVLVKSFYSAFTRILNQDERLGNVSEIVPALIIFLHMEPIQVAAGSAAAGFSSTLSPQPQADV